MFQLQRRAVHHFEFQEKLHPEKYLFTASMVESDSVDRETCTENEKTAESKDKWSDEEKEAMKPVKPVYSAIRGVCLPLVIIIFYKTYISPLFNNYLLYCVLSLLWWK